MVTKYCSGDENEKNEMGPACSTYGARRDVIRVLVGNPEKTDHLVHPGVDGRIIIR